MNQNESASETDIALAAGLVKRANLRGWLFCSWRLTAELAQLEADGRVQWVAPTPTSLGGWAWIPREILSSDAAPRRSVEA